MLLKNFVSNSQGESHNLYLLIENNSGYALILGNSIALSFVSLRTILGMHWFSGFYFRFSIFFLFWVNMFDTMLDYVLFWGCRWWI